MLIVLSLVYFGVVFFVSSGDSSSSSSSSSITHQLQRASRGLRQLQPTTGWPMFRVRQPKEAARFAFALFHTACISATACRLRCP